MTVGSLAVDVVPSPNDQTYFKASPSGSVDLFTKETVNPSAKYAKSAFGAWLAGSTWLGKSENEKSILIFTDVTISSIVKPISILPLMLLKAEAISAISVITDVLWAAPNWYNESFNAVNALIWGVEEVFTRPPVISLDAKSTASSKPKACCNCSGEPYSSCKDVKVDKYNLSYLLPTRVNLSKP